VLSFENDYSEGAHPKLLQALIDTNFIQQVGYGEDEFSLRAKEKIRAACQDPEADVFFLVGGTQTNAVVIDGLLSGTEGVVAASTGHVNVHEAGAIEYTGHKVLTVPEKDGKIDAEDLRALLSGFYADPTHSHMVYPGAVYISHPTEYGSLYSLAELTRLRDVCRAYGIPLFLDGARLGYGLESYETDVTLPDIARLCDAFYIGGTKCGAFCGEALVVPDPQKVPHLFTMIKQHGYLLAKGFLAGLQFERLFEDGLYLSIGKTAVALADRIRRALTENGYEQPMIAPTNQVFVTFRNDRLQALQQQVRVSFWEKADDSHTVVRIATDWATTQQDVDALLALF
jgi:threonine aldolase